MEIEGRRERTPAWLRVLRVLFAVVLVAVVLFGYQLARLYTDWAWFGELGRASVFTTILSVRLTLFFGMGLLFFLIFYLNVWLAGRINATAQRPRFMDPERELYARMARMAARWLGVGGAVFLAFLVGGNAATHWSEYLQFTHAERFGIREPVFGLDVGFYAFRLPFLRYLQGFLLFTIGAAAVGSAVVHYGERAADFVGGSLTRVPQGVRRHLLFLAAAFAAVWAWGHWLARYDVLWNNNGAFVGAGYADVHARVPGQVVQTILMLLVAALCVLNTRSGRPFLLPLSGLVVWAVGSVIMVGIWPALVQRFRVVPNQFTAEKPFIERDIAFTDKAYNLERVKEQVIPAVELVTARDMAEDSDTIENIRLWDWPQLGAVFEAKQALWTYYRFHLPEFASFTTADFNIDVDRYEIGGTVRQVMVAPRELYPEGLPPQARTWVNLRLQYTHGYGVVMSPVNRVDPQGLPEYYLGQIPVASTVPGLKVDRPQIYYGELARDYVIVASHQDELDYPSPEGNKLTRYSGKGGTRLGGSLSRMLWAMRLGDANMLLSGDISANSRILFRRNIRERVQTLAPFLNWDNDPYIVLHDGRLVWVMDGYTVSDRFPYSRPTEVGMGEYAAVQSFNYIRNSVKAVVDAYDGTVTFYIADPADPVLRLWSRVFRGLFVSMERMPAGLKRHLRYPEDLFRIQRDIYTIYHMRDARTYYGKEEQWEVPPDPGVQSDDGYERVGRMTPYYVNMRLPGSDRTEFILMTPFTPLRKQNMSGWMCAKCDPEDYGQLLVYRYPKGTNVNGPQQIMAQINAQEEISKVVTLLGQRGSRVIWGNLLAIPVGRGVLYALPLYVQAAGAQATAIPEISQVVLATGDRIVMRPTLEEAVAALGGPAGSQRGARDHATPVPEAPHQTQAATSTAAGPAEALNRARAALERARARQRDYEAALDELSRALQDLQTQMGRPK